MEIPKLQIYSSCVFFSFWNFFWITLEASILEFFLLGSFSAPRFSPPLKICFWILFNFSNEEDRAGGE